MPRIISLLPSSTEIVSVLGFMDELVGRSHECDYPVAVEKLPVCTKPKFNPEGTSREINQRVKDVLEQALAVYQVDAAQLAALKPDIIITQSQCEVCAVSLAEVEAAVSQLVDSKPVIVSLEPNGLTDVWADIQRVADALGVSDRGRELIAAFQHRMTRLAQQARQLTHQPTVAGIEWLEPLMGAGNWMPELVEMAGGVNLFGLAGKHSPWVTWEELIEADPEVIVMLPCGYDIQKTLSEMPILMKQPAWSTLKAVQQERVYVTDGNHYFNRPGPRLVESLEILAEIFHPTEFHFGYQGSGWVRA